MLSDTQILYVVPLKKTSPLFELAKQVRMEVFVAEQQVPAEVELDDIDAYAQHWLVVVKKDAPSFVKQQFSHKLATEDDILAIPDAWKPISTLRMFPYGKYVKVGRVAVIKEFRGLGVASIMMEHAEKYALDSSKQTVEFLLHSQCDKSGFYEKIGYDLVDANKFIEDGILHVKMKKVLVK